jgi:hypothetical protein
MYKQDGGGINFKTVYNNNNKKIIVLNILFYKYQADIQLRKEKCTPSATLEGH